ncbi:cysteine desulfurase NifS [bacterium]|nr:cysteine desulfurase NifS [bacterium]|tara:strand:- start:6394 stop:7563 length:1170 start_codon:yes stop_codon:yes gene_type:complete
MKKRRNVYLDYAAATPVDPRVMKRMRPFFSDTFGNPHSIHAMGKEAKESVEEARKEIAGVLGIRSKGIIFTSGGTEANNMALLGVVRAIKKEGKVKNPHVITTEFEHSSVRELPKELEREGCLVTSIPVTEAGVVNIDALKKALTKNTVLVSVMMVNNEIGTTQPVREIGNIIKEHRTKNASVYPYFHTDASQAPRYLSTVVAALGIDLMTLDGAKIYGPKSVGVLYKKEDVPLLPLMWGGGQENVLRPGTENVPGIVGMAEALTISHTQRTKDNEHLEKLKHYFIDSLQKQIFDIEINGDPENSVPGIVNVLFYGHDGERIVIFLEGHGVYTTTSSACSNGGGDPSHVIASLGRNPKEAMSSVRFSLGRETKKADIDYVVKVLSTLEK